MMIKILDIPGNSILKTDGVIYDYMDNFQGEFNDLDQTISCKEIGKLFFTSAPRWVGILFAIRNKIAGLFGLKSSGNISDRPERSDNFKFEVGDHYGLFKVFNITNKEVVVGANDKHLNFKVSLFLDNKASEINKKTLTMSTVVNFNNWYGRLYFLPVRPLHRLIVPVMLKRIIKQIENKSRFNT